MVERNEWGQPVGPRVPNWTRASLPPRVALTGRYCSVVPLSVHAHGHDLSQAFGRDRDGSRWTYLPYGPFNARGEFQAWLEASARGNDPLFYAIVDGTGHATGLAAYLRITPATGSVEVGHINFSASLGRQRAATEAMFLMMHNAFALGYRRYEWKCDALNLASWRAAERLGFTYEGTHRQALVYKGRNRDTAWFAIIDSDWPKLEGAFRQWLAPENFDPSGSQRTRLSTLTSSIVPRSLFPRPPQAH